MHRAEHNIAGTGGCRACLAILYASECAAITIACDVACCCHWWRGWDAANRKPASHGESNFGPGICPWAGHSWRGVAWRHRRFCPDHRLPSDSVHSSWHTGRMWYRHRTCAVGRSPAKRNVLKNLSMKENRPHLVVVLGPTASGKSTLGITLALHFIGEIVSADSRQVYRGLDIGTAKVTAEEQALIPHHLIDVTDVRETFTVSQFQQLAIAAINDILARGRQPFLVGGSPHYIQAVVDNLLIPSIPPQPALRAELAARPLSELLAQLEALDSRSAAVLDRNNRRRVIRALEVCLISGRAFSEQRKMADPLYESLLLGIEWPREVLYHRIDTRVDERMQQGMVQEVRNLLEQEISHERLEALGLEYRFISRWLRGEFTSEREMVQRLKFAIHDFTRRQLTWFRKDKRILWVEGENAYQEVCDILDKRVTMKLFH